MPPIRALLVAALPGEALPLIRRMTARRWLDHRLVLGRLGGVSVALLCCGVGREAARARTAAALVRCPADRLVSVGTCGALVDDLPVGCLVEARGLLEPAGPLPTFGLGARAVLLATVPRVIDRPEERAAWAARGAEACEMEAAGVLEAAGGRPFLAVKVVSDRAGACAVAGPRWPGSVRRAAFQILAARLVERHLAHALEVWLEAEERAEGP